MTTLYRSINLVLITYVTLKFATTFKKTKFLLVGQGLRRLEGLCSDLPEGLSALV